MPSKSKAQHNLMAAVANNPKFAKKAGIPQTVGGDYMKADKKVMKYKAGGLPMGAGKGYKKGGKTQKVSKKDMPMYLDRPRTALERTSPKTAAALEALEKKQKGLAMRNMLRDELGSKLDNPNSRVEMGGKEVTGLKKGGKIRGYGMARGGKVCKMR
jgi:hypothetical protein